MTHLADLAPTLQRTDPGRPRITWYALGGPTDGERIELSGAVLANWAAKATGLLQDELDAGPGTRVALDLPPHWRSLYWALAAWQTGARVLTTAEEADVVVTADPAGAPDGDDLVVVTLAALARRAAVPVPSGAVDEARTLATFPDAVQPYARAAGSDPALDTPALSFDVVPAGAPRRLLLVVGPGSPVGPWLARCAQVLAGGGSVVVVRAEDDERAQDRLLAVVRQERIDEGDVVRL